MTWIFRGRLVAAEGPFQAPQAVRQQESPKASAIRAGVLDLTACATFLVSPMAEL
jgi:hypothetical protein